MFAEYIPAALRHAKYGTLEDGTSVATVEGLRCIIAVGDAIEDCSDNWSHRRLGGTGSEAGLCHPIDCLKE